MDGPNLFAYTGNNPINFVDLYGLEKDGTPKPYNPWSLESYKAMFSAEYWSEFNKGTDWYIHEYLPRAQLEWDRAAALWRERYPAEQARLRQELRQNIPSTLVFWESEEHFIGRHIGSRPARIGIAWDLVKLYAPAIIMGSGPAAAPGRRIYPTPTRLYHRTNAALEEIQVEGRLVARAEGSVIRSRARCCMDRGRKADLQPRLDLILLKVHLVCLSDWAGSIRRALATWSWSKHNSSGQILYFVRRLRLVEPSQPRHVGYARLWGRRVGEWALPASQPAAGYLYYKAEEERINEGIIRPKEK